MKSIIFKLNGMEWKPGLILRIKSYKFEDDGSSRDKYAIILHTNDKELYLIHSLTTSQNNLSVPGMHYGCSVHIGVPYYFIPASIESELSAFKGTL